jgi:hypothetical protein
MQLQATQRPVPAPTQSASLVQEQPSLKHGSDGNSLKEPIL